MMWWFCTWALLGHSWHLYIRKYAKRYILIQWNLWWETIQRDHRKWSFITGGLSLEMQMYRNVGPKVVFHWMLVSRHNGLSSQVSLYIYCTQLKHLIRLWFVDIAIRMTVLLHNTHYVYESNWTHTSAINLVYIVIDCIYFIFWLSAVKTGWNKQIWNMWHQ